MTTPTVSQAAREAAQTREWTKWNDQRPPNAAGEFRYRATFDLLGVTVTPEWTEKMTLCGMGYSDGEWWPLSSCHWDGYQRRITIANLEWSPVLAYDPAGIVWNGLDLLPCPFSGAAPTISAQGRYIGAPLWHTEALWISSPRVPRSRWTNAKSMQDVWNARLTTPDSEVARAEVEAERLFKMQGGPMIPWSLAETIYEAYSTLYGTSQSLERLHERGGFGWGEVEVIFSELRKRKPEKWAELHERDKLRRSRTPANPTEEPQS